MLAVMFHPLLQQSDVIVSPWEGVWLGREFVPEFPDQNQFFLRREFLELGNSFGDHVLPIAQNAERLKANWRIPKMPGVK
jgi:hypothetical protein